MYLYMIKMENGDYLNINLNASCDEELFSTTSKVSECAMLNKDLLKKFKILLKDYNNRLYICNERQFLKPLNIEKYELLLKSTEDLP